jgi:hypothetical protein
VAGLVAVAITVLVVEAQVVFVQQLQRLVVAVHLSLHYL